MIGPSLHVLDTGVFKNFVVREQRYLQFRWEMFNALNQVNLANPAVTLGVATAGLITPPLRAIREICSSA